ncbi:hypothetical protein SAMN04487785_11413 [Dyella jiangningensis]|uniref:hypothetical protein n=1 Tax=Dyella sp. AtDHG13 TaxID=1938897 RepID=UPI000885A171|nr:hypothetical protein [Dyella sp. AtDHG13]PXV54207.1 hypothetical protein BDW41_113160 [Dyella sp. AtDHG13]SDL04023.1 hypothetical protein SAMN04487785_11413 [Dyella jiangningensis]
MKRGLKPGYGTNLEFGMRFLLWADGLGHWPNFREVMSAFGVSKASAYRYLDSYRNVKSVELTRKAA